MNAKALDALECTCAVQQPCCLHAMFFGLEVLQRTQRSYMWALNLSALREKYVRPFIQACSIMQYIGLSDLLALQALKAVKQIALVRPGDIDIVKQLARLHHSLGNAAEAKEALQTHLHSYPTAVDLELINILAELYMNTEEWSLAVDNIQYANAQLCGPTGLPIDLQVDFQQHTILPLLQAFMHIKPLAALDRHIHNNS